MNNSISLKKIKLIIWDLDDTIWKGTISEGNVDLSSKNSELIVNLSKKRNC